MNSQVINAILNNITVVFFIQIVVFSLPPFYIATLQRPLRSVAFYTYVSIVLLLGGFLGSVYSLPLSDSIIISGGNLTYGALMYATILLVIVEGNIFAIRNVIRLVITINVLKYILFSIFSWSLSLDAILNPFNVAPELFSVSARFMIIGGALIIVELLILLFAFERIKARVNSYYALSGLYILSFVSVLLLDGVLFPFLAFGFDPALIDIIAGGVGGKFVMAVAYSLSLFVFLIVFRNQVSTYIDSPLDFSNLLSVSKEKLIAEVDRQQKSLVEKEEALRENEERLRLALMATNLGLYDLNMQTQEVQVNDQYALLLGYDPDTFEETIEQWEERLHPADRESAMNRLHACFAGSAAEYVADFRLKTKAGDWIWVTSKGKIVSYDERGNPLRMLGTNIDITARREAELALKDSYTRLQALFDHSQDAILLANDQGQYVDANPAACILTGYLREELLQLSIWNLTPEMNRTQGEAMWQQFLAAGEGGGDFTIQAKDGRLIEAEFRAVANIVPGLHLSIMRNVTERRQMEEALRAREADLLKAQRIGGMGSWQLDIEQDIVTWSEQIYEIFGISKEMFGGTFEAFFEFVHPEDRDRLMEAQMPAERGDAPLDVEHRIIRPDGEIRYVHERAEAVFNGSETPVKLIGTVRDITAEKKAKNEMAQRNKFISTILDNLPIGLAVNYIDEGKAAYMNARFEEIYGWPREKLTDIEQFFERVYPDPAYRAEVQARISADLASGDPERMQWEGIEITTEEGEKRVVSAKNISIAEQNFMISTVQDTTARSRAEAALQETNERLRAIIESSPVGIIVLTLAGRVTMWSPAAERIFGWTAAEVIGRPYPGAAQPEMETEFQQNLTQLAAGEVVDGFETRRQRKDGTMVDIMLNLAPVFDSTSEVVAAMGMVSDISARKHAEAQLVEYTQRLEALHKIDRAILAQSSAEEIAEVVVDHLSELVDCQRISAGWIDETGDRATVLAVYVQDDATSMQRGQTVPIEGNQAVLAALRQGKIQIFSDLTQFSEKSTAIRQLVQEGLRSYMTVPLLAADQLIGTLSLGAKEKNAFDESQELFVQEVADQLSIALRQARLLEAEQAQRLLAETLQQTAVTLGGSLGLLETLDAILNQLALVVDYDLAQVLLIEGEMLSVGARQGTLADDAETKLTRPYSEIRPLRQALQSGKSIMLSAAEISQNQLDLPGLAPTLITWVGVPLIARDVAIGFLTVGSARDAYQRSKQQAITAFAQQAALAIEKATILADLQNSLRTLKEAQARLLRTARLSAIGETAAGVAHQINNPLMTVVIDSHLLMKNLPEDDAARQSAEAIHQAARRAAQIVERLLDFSQTEPTHKTAVDIGDSVQEAVTLILAQLPPEITLRLHAAPDLPPVQASRDHLQDVWLNLLLNARDAILPVDGGTITVELSHNEAEQQIVVAITDDGMGIPVDDQPNLFTPFFTTKAQGTGLGLAVCYDIIQHHGGVIHAHSIEGEGSTFEVVLPLATASAESAS